METAPPASAWVEQLKLAKTNPRTRRVGAGRRVAGETREGHPPVLLLLPGHSMAATDSSASYLFIDPSNNKQLPFNARGLRILFAELLLEHTAHATEARETHLDNEGLLAYSEQRQPQLVAVARGETLAAIDLVEELVSEAKEVEPEGPWPPDPRWVDDVTTHVVTTLLMTLKMEDINVEGGVEMLENWELGLGAQIHASTEEGEDEAVTEFFDVSSRRRPYQLRLVRDGEILRLGERERGAKEWVDIGELPVDAAGSLRLLLKWLQIRVLERRRGS